MSGKLAVFLDKDGTLVRDVPYNVDPSRIVLNEGAVDGVRRLHAAGFALVVVSNQSGVARGYFAEADLGVVWAKLRELLGVPFLVYYCPHHPESDAPYNVECRCRKPEPGMLLEAAKEHRLDLSQSWMIGDILNDVEAGRRAGCRTVLLDNGGETEWVLSLERLPHHVVSTFAEAAEVILALQKESNSASQHRLEQSSKALSLDLGQHFRFS